MLAVSQRSGIFVAAEPAGHISGVKFPCSTPSWSLSMSFAESITKSAKRSSATESIQLSPVPSKRASKLSDIDFFQPPHPHQETKLEKNEYQDFDFFQPTAPALTTDKPMDESYNYSARRISKTSEPGVGVTIIEVPPAQVASEPPDFPEGGFWGWMTLFGA